MSRRRNFKRCFKRCFATFIALVTLSLAFGCEKSPEPEAPAAQTSTVHTHAKTGETCFICDASKRDAGRMWCKEHARYEDRCWECHPDLREVDRAYCEEHQLYEDECFLCDAARAGGTTAEESTEEAIADGDSDAGGRKEEAEHAKLFCNEHQVPEHDCGICRPDRAAELATGEWLLVRMPSAQSADLAGLVIKEPQRADATTAISLLGEVRFNGNRLAQATPLASGVIAQVNVDVGDVVEAGTTLAVIKSPEVAQAKANYLTARTELELQKATVERERQLFEEKIGSRSGMESAEAAFSRTNVAVKLAGQQLRNLGFSKGELSRIQDSTSALSLKAPFKGTVVKRSAVVGEAVDTATVLFEIADLSEMWVELSVPEEHAPSLLMGCPLDVKVRGQKGAIRRGELIWVSPVVDEQTRMVGARGLVANADSQLRHGMFAEVSAILAEHPDSLRLPASAVHRLNDLPFVFVRREPDLFAALRVEVGDRVGDTVVIRSGLNATDAVVVDGGFVVKSALLASRLGAGCADD